MGICIDKHHLWVSTQYQLWRFDNILAAGEAYRQYDAFYCPRFSYVTGELDIHDIDIDKNGRVMFVNTLFSCIAEPSLEGSFKPVWRPPFISSLAAEDRCHLNGLAMKDGGLAFATAISGSDAAGAWRNARADGGIVLDIGTNDVLLQGLSMPHSPRWRNGALWLLNSGYGALGYVDFKKQAFEEVAFCPGYARGLDFIDDYAVITTSLPRHNEAFSGLPLERELNARNIEPHCGLVVVDISKGDAVHWLRIDGARELFDVKVIPGVQKPAAVGFKSDEIKRVISIAP